ncbi:MAG: hypothetical protein IPI57_15735 [Candidatus Competibacteraceae bacterium]|nr:hypothetical protein [Candidatus Competibacteraceae bacterium]
MLLIDPWDNKTLVLKTGAYGQRMAWSLKYLGRRLQLICITVVMALDMGDARRHLTPSRWR